MPADEFELNDLDDLPADDFDGQELPDAQFPGEGDEIESFDFSADDDDFLDDPPAPEEEEAPGDSGLGFEGFEAALAESEGPSEPEAPAPAEEAPSEDDDDFGDEEEGIPGMEMPAEDDDLAAFESGGELEELSEDGGLDDLAEGGGLDDLTEESGLDDLPDEAGLSFDLEGEDDDLNSGPVSAKPLKAAESAAAEPAAEAAPAAEEEAFPEESDEIEGLDDLGDMSGLEDLSDEAPLEDVPTLEDESGLEDLPEEEAVDFELEDEPELDAAVEMGPTAEIEPELPAEEDAPTEDLEELEELEPVALEPEAPEDEVAIDGLEELEPVEEAFLSEPTDELMDAGPAALPETGEFDDEEEQLIEIHAEDDPLAFEGESLAESDVPPDAPEWEDLESLSEEEPEAAALDEASPALEGSPSDLEDLEALENPPDLHDEISDLPEDETAELPLSMDTGASELEDLPEESGLEDLPDAFAEEEDPFAEEPVALEAPDEAPELQEEEVPFAEEEEPLPPEDAAFEDPVDASEETPELELEPQPEPDLSAVAGASAASIVAVAGMAVSARPQSDLEALRYGDSSHHPNVPVENQPMSQPNSPAASGSEVLLNFQHEVVVEVARTKLTGEEITQITYGSVIELDKLAGEPVELVLDGKTIAHAEVVLINKERLGVRIIGIMQD